MSNRKGKGKAATQVEEPVYDPEQDPEEKRRIRDGYRDQIRSIEEQSKDFKSLDVSLLAEGVQRADLSFSGVRAPQEAILDSRYLTAVSHISAAKARDLKHDGGGFDTDDFIQKLVAFLGGNRIEVQAEDEDEDAEAREVELNWEKLGWKMMGKTRRAVGLEFMYGPLNVVPKTRIQKPRAKVEKHNDVEVKPEEVNVAELNKKDETETSALVAKVSAQLANLPEGQNKINFYRLIVNPDSFSQSVENLFYVAFLVRLGDVSLELNEETDELEVYAVDRPDTNDRDAGLSRNQAMWEFDEETWRMAIDTYGIENSFIEDRGNPPESAYRFYN